jgi:hypothetical protein
MAALTLGEHVQPSPVPEGARRLAGGASEASNHRSMSRNHHDPGGVAVFAGSSRRRITDLEALRPALHQTNAGRERCQAPAFIASPAIYCRNLGGFAGQIEISSGQIEISSRQIEISPRLIEVSSRLIEILAAQIEISSGQTEISSETDRDLLPDRSRSLPDRPRSPPGQIVIPSGLIEISSRQTAILAGQIELFAGLLDLFARCPPG